ncbi:hypothetical protein CYMTET_54638 [Cymbomonas tetramitiformis]|uniref:Uncharacterized protein n=1 Tax=Cymbomonas tetramitiformis TaxID=36881 RepID=A0AAE0BFX6_9CHLO|nr:hypothetical protein CYMTET_54638 [Cymbomonas tetramitiformis]
MFANIIILHLLRTKVELGLLPTHPSVVILDCWPPQKQQSFRDAVSSKWPWVFLHYVPPGCTGIIQKFDVDGGGVIKPAACHGLCANRGWAKTKIPTAFEAETRQKAAALHREGKLWPSSGATVIVFDGDEEEPDAATTDWADVTDHTTSQAEASTSAAVENAHRNTFDDVGQAIVEATESRRNKRSRAQAEDEEEITFEDMTVDTVAITLATSKDGHAFKVKVGRSLSDWLNLVRVDPHEAATSIPEQFYDEMVIKLSAIMKAKKKAA